MKLSAPQTRSTELLDRHVSLPDLREAIARHPRLADALLDLRQALSEMRLRPTQAVAAYFRHRAEIESRDYMLIHRIRRELERQLELEFTTPTRCERRPLRLEGRRLPTLFGSVRREVFEQGESDWGDIRIRLVARALDR